MSKRAPQKFRLPDAVGKIAEATRALRDRYSDTELDFTPDGKFVGDLGEAIAMEMFGIQLDQRKGIDGYFGDVPVQVKATGRSKGGAVFRSIDEAHPDNTHLIVYFIDWSRSEGELIFNGKESLVRPNCKKGQREASRHKMLTTDTLGDELPIKETFRSRYMSK
ncbi:MAG: hypothetical protein AAF291_11215 [Pseudomonadota bacterium]